MIYLIDSSILLEILSVPKHSVNGEKYRKEFLARAQAGCKFILPFATIIETGNFIGQIVDGGTRRHCAKSFRDLLVNAVRGSAPFISSPYLTKDLILESAESFVDWTVHYKSGFGDLTILKEYMAYRAFCLYSKKDATVAIWSLDEHLSAHNIL